MKKKKEKEKKKKFEKGNAEGKKGRENELFY